jgi:hypothetical protein
MLSHGMWRHDTLLLDSNGSKTGLLALCCTQQPAMLQHDKKQQGDMAFECATVWRISQQQEKAITIFVVLALATMQHAKV